MALPPEIRKLQLSINRTTQYRVKFSFAGSFINFVIPDPRGDLRASHASELIARAGHGLRDLKIINDFRPTGHSYNDEYKCYSATWIWAH